MDKPPEKIKTEPWEKFDKYDCCNNVNDVWHKWIDEAPIEQEIARNLDKDDKLVIMANAIRKMLKGENIK